MLSHTSRSSRHALLISATVALAIGGLARTAAAKDCTTDTDCDTGYQCVIQAVAATGGATSVGSASSSGSGEVGTGGAGGSAASVGGAVGSSCPKGTNCAVVVSTPPMPVPAPDAGALSPAEAGVLPPETLPTPVTGICEPKPVVCSTVADCPSADFDCVMEAISPPACLADQNCATLSPASTTGTCVAKAHACSTADDCPTPLTCQALPGTCTSSGSVGPDGKVISTPTTCAMGPSVCSWNPVTCTTNSDCTDPLYQCVKVDETTSCTGSGGACAAGLTCPPVPEQPPTCVTTPTMYCLPKLVDCASGPACAVGWSCFDFSNVGGVPPAWGSVPSNMACLPDGIVMAAQGHAAVNGQLVVGSGSSSSSSSGGTPTLDVGGAGGASGGAGGVSGNDGKGTSTGGGQSNVTNPPTASPVATNEGAAGASGSAQPMAHSSGCAYGGSDASSSWLALAMIGLVARLARRRREDR
jgi:MYXO-CTERM domain-containing protein